MNLPMLHLCGEITVMDYTILRLFILGNVASPSRPVDGYLYWGMHKGAAEMV
jgi:hypothetical protein